MKSKIIIWAIMAFVFGLGLGCYIGYNFGYDQATSSFIFYK